MRITLTLPQAMVDRLRDIARRHDIGPSALVEMLVTAGLERGATVAKTITLSEPRAVLAAPTATPSAADELFDED